MGTPSLPVVVDFSKTAIQRTVISNIVQNPILLTTACGGVLALLAGALFSFPYVVFGGGVGMLVGVGGGMFQYFLRHNSLVAKQLANYNTLLDQQAEELAEYLRKEFATLQFDRGEQQVETLRDNLDALERVLAEKFDQQDTTYHQFYGAAKTLYVQSLNTLKDAATQLRANQAVDSGYLRKTGKTANDHTNLDRRDELHREGQARFEQLIDSVETAITGLSELIHEVAKVGTLQGQSHDDFIRRVRELASQASQYVDERRLHDS